MLGVNVILGEEQSTKTLENGQDVTHVRNRVTVTQTTVVSVSRDDLRQFFNFSLYTACSDARLEVPYAREDISLFASMRGVNSPSFVRHLLSLFCRNTFGAASTLISPCTKKASNSLNIHEERTKDRLCHNNLHKVRIPNRPAP